MENQEQKTPETYSHPFIKKDSIIKIEVSEFYLTRCQKLLIALAGDMGNDKFLETINKLKEEKPIETFEEAILDVVLPLIISIEEAADAQGLTEIKTYDPEMLKKMYDAI